MGTTPASLRLARQAKDCVVDRKKPVVDGIDVLVVEDLAHEAQKLHSQRRARVEKFLREIGPAPAQSASRNPLEQPWTLTPDEFTSRAPHPDHKHFPAADGKNCQTKFYNLDVIISVGCRVKCHRGTQLEVGPQGNPILSSNSHFDLRPRQPGGVGRSFPAGHSLS